PCSTSAGRHCSSPPARPATSPPCTRPPTTGCTSRPASPAFPNRPRRSKPPRAPARGEPGCRAVGRPSPPCAAPTTSTPWWLRCPTPVTSSCSASTATASPRASDGGGREARHGGRRAARRIERERPVAGHRHHLETLGVLVAELGQTPGLVDLPAFERPSRLGQLRWVDRERPGHLALDRDVDQPTLFDDPRRRAAPQLDGARPAQGLDQLVATDRGAQGGDPVACEGGLLES